MSKLFKEYEAVAKNPAERAFVYFRIEEEDSHEDEIDDCIKDKRLSQVFAYIMEIW